MTGNVAFFAAYAQTKIFLANREKNRRIEHHEILQRNSDMVGKNHGFGSVVKTTDLINGKIKLVKEKETELNSVIELENHDGSSSSSSSSRSRSRSSCSSDENTQAQAQAQAKLDRESQRRAGRGVLLAGAMAGLAYVISSHPLEIASILMQIDVPTRALSHPLPTPIPLPFPIPCPPLPVPFNSAAVVTSLPSISTSISASLSGPLLLSAKAMTSSLTSASHPSALPLSPVCSALTSSVRTATTAVHHAVLRIPIFQSVFKSGTPLTYRLVSQ